MVTNADKTFTD